MLALLVGCTAPTAGFCDEETACEDPDRPYCDVAGDFGSSNKCIATPSDNDAGTSGVPSCPDYCEVITANCTDTDAQFPSNEVCLSYCSENTLTPIGTFMDLTGNTLGCRINHAELASSDPGTHCPQAGPSGGGNCGTWCETYCRWGDAFCTGESAIPFTISCSIDCRGFNEEGQWGDATGDTVQCRLYHLDIIEQDSELRCSIASPAGGGVCVPL